MVVGSDGGDSWGRDGGVGVGGHVHNRRVGQELHDHTDVLLVLREHHGALHTQQSMMGMCQLRMVIGSALLLLARLFT